MNYQLEKCQQCCWAKKHDGKIFCLFANTTCLKDDQVFINAVGEKTKPEIMETNENE